jgi:pimeloyl-ACP methyl ester carboxylesterase
VVFGGLLAAGGHRRPVYGFQSRLLDDDTPLPASVADLAARYVAELVEKQPAGDCLLAGECVGGVIAMEMAQQLTAMGRRVARLILLDVQCPTAESAEKYRQSGRKNLERVHGSNLADRVFPYYSALCGYRPRPYAGLVDLVVSEESIQRKGRCMGWDDHLKGPVRTFRAPGNHDSYIRQHRDETGVLLAGLLGESGLAGQ